MTRDFLWYYRGANHRSSISLPERFVNLCQGKGVRDELVKRIALKVAPYDIKRLRDDPRLIGGKRHQGDAAENDATSLKRCCLLGVDAPHYQVVAAVLQHAHSLGDDRRRAHHLDADVSPPALGQLPYAAYP